MESLVITWRELLVVIVLVLAVYIAEILLLMRAGGKIGWRARLINNEGGQRAELDALQGKVADLHERLEKIQAEIEEMKQTQVSTPYSKAIQSAQQGLDASQLAANCGISRGEAELIVALHKTKQT